MSDVRDRETCNRPGCEKPADIRVTDDLALCTADAKPMLPEQLR